MRLSANELNEGELTAVAAGPIARGQRAAGWLAAAALGLMVYGTLLPLAFDVSRGPWSQGRWLARLSWSIGSVEDLVVNVVICVPIGVLLAWRLGSWRVGWVRVAAVTLVVAGLSYTVESLQSMLPGRVPAWSDVILNTAGGWLGAMLSSAVVMLGWLAGQWLVGLAARGRRVCYRDRRVVAILAVAVYAGVIGIGEGIGGLNLMPFARHFHQSFVAATCAIGAAMVGALVVGLAVASCFGWSRRVVGSVAAMAMVLVVALASMVVGVLSCGGGDVTAVVVAGVGAWIGAWVRFGVAERGSFKTSSLWVIRAPAGKSLVTSHQ